jgi:AbrB family looped-hinge helix DNA binding protein
MKITKLSTKGQIVIPEELRQGMETGTAFMVTRQNNLIVLKKIAGLTKKEMEEMKELDKIWQEIDEGKGITQNKEEFLKEMNAW